MASLDTEHTQSFPCMTRSFSDQMFNGALHLRCICEPDCPFLLSLTGHFFGIFAAPAGMGIYEVLICITCARNGLYLGVLRHRFSPLRWHKSAYLILTHAMNGIPLGYCDCDPTESVPFPCALLCRQTLMTIFSSTLSLGRCTPPKVICGMIWRRLYVGRAIFAGT